MVKSAEGSAGLLHDITKPTAWRREARILRKEEEGVRLLDRCEAKEKEWAKHWQCDEGAQNMDDKPWKNEELKKLEEALPSLKECDLEKASRLKKGQNRSGIRSMASTQKSQWTRQEKRAEKELLEKVELSGKWPQQACTTEEFHE